MRRHRLAYSTTSSASSVGGAHQLKSVFGLNRQECPISRRLARQYTPAPRRFDDQPKIDNQDQCCVNNVLCIAMNSENVRGTISRGMPDREKLIPSAAMPNQPFFLSISTPATTR